MANHLTPDELSKELGIEHGGRRGGEVVDRRAPRQRLRTGVTGQVDREHAVALEQLRHDLDPVVGRAAQPVDE